MPVRLSESLASTETIGRIFADESVLRAMLDFECALAKVEERLRIIPDGCADAIASATDSGLDPSLYGEAGLRSTHEAQHTVWIKRWRGEKGV